LPRITVIPEDRALCGLKDLGLPGCRCYLAGVPDFELASTRHKELTRIVLFNISTMNISTMKGTAAWFPAGFVVAKLTAAGGKAPIESR
jgi:hypothetical protein